MATQYYEAVPTKGAPPIIVGTVVEGQDVSGWGAAVGANWGFCFKGDVADNILAGMLYEGTGGPVELSPFAWDISGNGADLRIAALGLPLSGGEQQLKPVTEAQAGAAFAKFGGGSPAQMAEQFASCRKTIRLGEAVQR